MNRSTNHTEALLNENIIDIRYYWNVLMYNKWWILALGLIVAAIAAIVASRIEPVYRATTTVLIENSEANVVSIEGVYGLNTRAKEYFLTQFEILKSRELAERLVDRLELTRHPEFDPRQQTETDWRSQIPSPLGFLEEWFTEEAEIPLTDDQIRAQVLAQFNKALKVEPVSNTQLVKINFEAHDPKLAAQVANELAEVYIESNMEARLKMTQKAAGWLTGRLEGLNAKLKESEAKLQAYREQETLVESAGVNSMSEQELNELTLRHVAAINARSQAQNLLDQVRATGPAPSVEQLLELPSILQQDLVRTLKTAQAAADLKVAELAKRYGSRHPAMIAARTEAEETRRELSLHVMRAARGIESEYETARETERAIAAQLNRAKDVAQSVNRKEFRLSELERDVETNRQLYDMFLTRAKETGETDGLQSAHARVIDPAAPPRVPVAPNTNVIVLMALMASLALGILLAFIRDALDNTVKSPEDVEDKLRTSMLGFLPKTKKSTRKMPLEGFLSSNFSPFAEAVRSLRTGIMLSSIDKPYKTILVTSTLAAEGKSTVALNLAAALGQMERVLLVEADMRQPVFARALKLHRDTPGLSDLVAGMDDLKACIHPMADLGIDVMVAGSLPGNPQELLSSKRFLLVLEVLKRHYGRIVIDSPPTHPVSDAMVLSSLADGVIYVVKAGETPTALAAKGIKRLRDVRAHIIGAVLNQVDIRKRNRYGEYYAEEYQHYGNARAIIQQPQRKQSRELVLP